MYEHMNAQEAANEMLEDRASQNFTDVRTLHFCTFAPAFAPLHLCTSDNGDDDDDDDNR